jgi:hypothetical protein
MARAAEPCSRVQESPDGVSVQAIYSKVDIQQEKIAMVVVFLTETSNNFRHIATADQLIHTSVPTLDVQPGACANLTSKHGPKDQDTPSVTVSPEHFFTRDIFSPQDQNGMSVLMCGHVNACVMYVEDILLYVLMVRRPRLCCVCAGVLVDKNQQ